MSNWFESNPAKSVIGHTIFVAAATWAIFIFVFDENKVNLHEAKVERVEAEAREIEARNSVLTTRIEYLTEENRKLNTWLGQAPSTIPYYERQLTDLTEKLKESEEKLAQLPEPSPTHSGESLYRNIKSGDAGTTFHDVKTNAVLGVSRISYGDIASVNLTLPGKGATQESDVTAGSTWMFTIGGAEYLLILGSIDWALQRFEASVVELSGGA